MSIFVFPLKLEVAIRGAERLEVSRALIRIWLVHFRNGFQGLK